MRNIGADKPKPSLRVIACSRLCQLGSYPSYALHGCPKSKSTPGFVASFLHMFVNWCTVYLHHNTSTRSVLVY